jgi:hypothetical protein
MKRAHTIPMTSGNEYDALTGWRHVYHWKPGTRKAIKRQYNRRQRTAELSWIRLEASKELAAA